MSRLNINISSNNYINAIYFGLVISGYEYSDINKSDAIIELSSQIKNYSGLDSIKQYFGFARQKTCEPYPFWPRAALLESITFFISGHGADFDKYYEYVKSLPNLTEEERNDDFFSWVRDFPEYLNEIKVNSFFNEIDRQIKDMVNKISTDTAAKRVRITDTLNTITDREIDISAISVVICPLKCIYSADYFARGSEMSVILGDFLPNSILHEYMHLIIHPEIMKYRKAILSLFGNKLFDIDKSYYLNNDENGFINAFEEHIVRTASGLVCNETEINIEQLIENELA